MVKFKREARHMVRERRTVVRLIGLVLAGLALAFTLADPAVARSSSHLLAASYPTGAPISVRVGMPCPGRPSCFAPGVPACSVCCKTYQAAVCSPGVGKTASCRCEW